jgi:hypothetical protein
MSLASPVARERDDDNMVSQCDTMSHRSTIGRRRPPRRNATRHDAIGTSKGAGMGLAGGASTCQAKSTCSLTPIGPDLTWHFSRKKTADDDNDNDDHDSHRPRPSQPRRCQHRVWPIGPPVLVTATRATLELAGSGPGALDRAGISLSGIALDIADVRPRQLTCARRPRCFLARTAEPVLNRFSFCTAQCRNTSPTRQ